jgi:hypothetical protein
MGPPSPLSNGYRELFSEVKRPGSEANHSPSSSVEVKNAWSYTANLPYVFKAWYNLKNATKISVHIGRLKE